MPAPFRLWENLPFTVLLPAAADAAGRTSSYVSLKNAHKAFLVCEVNQGNAAQVTFTPLQAQDNLGTNSKALTSAAPITLNNDTSTSTGSDQNVPQTSATSFQADTTLKDKLVVFEIQPEEVMDVNNTGGAFDHIAIQTSASNAGNITSAKLFYLPRDQRQQPPTTYL